MNSSTKEEKYNPSEIETKWQRRWEESGIYKPDLDKAKNPFYNLMMFPYPSAEGMHVGNMYAFTGSDIYGRFKRMQGYDVFEPIGLDGFGIHSENYAIQVGRHPKEQAKITEKNFYRQLKATGNGFDWSRTVETYDPEYYKWTQWIFIQLFKKGLAYRKKSPVNWCPKDKTVLADEQVIDGKCERCGSVVEKKDLEQWFFRITKYADRLLKNTEILDWSDKVRIAQREWIGRSEGALIKFQISNFKYQIEVFTTRPDTLFGATFMVLSPEYPLVAQVKDKKVQEYVERAKRKSEQERIAEGKDKTGVFTGLYAINPVTEKEIPIWVADYVLMGYGTGAIMGVPAHDQRDYDFAKKYNLQIIEVIKPEEGIAPKERAYDEPGTIINSSEWNGWKVPKDISKVIDWLEKRGLGKKELTYHLRDWLISRQRYWGPPIPMIYCEKCGWNPVSEKDLPVLLPDVKDWRPTGTGKAPLANHPEFYETSCPSCGQKAIRETDVSDTFLDSSWYFFRYVSTEDHSNPWTKSRVKKWLPVTMYIGGAEHSVLHLLYSRFLTMAFHDMDFVDFEEPFAIFRAHGLIIKDGAKMSKSKGNVVIPDEYIKKFGADALRTYLMFTGSYTQGGDFRDTGIEGMHKFIKRVWRLFSEHSENSANQKIRQSDISDNQKDRNTESSEFSEHVMHKTIKKVTEDIASLRYNTAIAALMEWYNYLSSKLKVQSSKLSAEEAETYLKLLAPFAPHMTEELWSRIGEKYSIHQQPWPQYDPKYLEEEEVTIVVQVNGKVRDTLRINNEELTMKNKIEQMVKQSDKVKKYLEGKRVLKTVYVEGKILNFVTS